MTCKKQKNKKNATTTRDTIVPYTCIHINLHAKKGNNQKLKRNSKAILKYPVPYRPVQ